jgi:CBS domain containing-hemolysin-like protein
MLAVRDANRRFNLKIPEEAGYTTMAGFLMAKAGRLLQPGETIEHEGLTFKVERVEGRRIRRVRFTPPPPASQTAAHALLLPFAMVSLEVCAPLV